MNIISNDLIIAFRGISDTPLVKRIDPNVMATEGVGIYVTTNKKFAESFGKLKKIIYKKPNNPLNVVNEELPLLFESDTLMDPIKSTDSIWIKSNKEAIKNSGVTDEDWRPGDVAKELSNILKEKYYDAVDISCGSESWTVILDKSLIQKENKV